MSYQKRITYHAKKYESRGETYTDRNGRTRKDTNLCLYDSMLESPAYIDLKPRVKVLYTYCKAQLYGKRKPCRDFKEVEELQNESYFYFNWALAQAYGLYKDSMERNFRRDMQELIEHGFIKLIASGAKRKQKNIYGFTDDWQVWKG